MTTWSLHGTLRVSHTEPDRPWRSEEHSGQRIAPGRISFRGMKGKVELRGLDIRELPAGEKNPADTLPPVDEEKDSIIRLQQRDFPVIDYHVHLKGGLTKEMAHAMSMNYGINNGVTPNAGEGGVGRMLANDAEIYEYYDFGRLEYAVEAIEACGLTPEDIWFPSMIIRSARL